MECKTPESLELDHDALRQAIADAVQAGGEVGAAAAAVLEVMGPHMDKEEELAFPPLAALVPVTEGRIDAQCADLILKCDRLREAIPVLREEHVQIEAALIDLVAAARGQGRQDLVPAAERLIAHVRLEEEFLYPAAVLVGEYLKLKLTSDVERKERKER